MDSYLVYSGTNMLGLGEGCNSSEPRFIDHGKQTEMYQRNVFERMAAERNINRRSSVNQGDQTVYEPAAQSSLSKGEMNFGDIPVVENTFSLPQNVFEKVWSSQQRVLTNTSTPSVSLTRTAPTANTAGQNRRPSGDYITELTGSDAKRPRLSPSEHASAQETHHLKHQQEELKLQLIMHRLNTTRDKVMRLLQQQKARDHLHHDDRNTHFEKGQPRYFLWRRNVPAPNNLPRSAEVENDAPQLHSQFQGPRHIPGINIVSTGARSPEQRSGCSYNTVDSAGIALDHQTFPKIVAVHSVMENAPMNADNCAATDSRPRVGAGTACEQHTITSDHMYDNTEVQRNTPLTNGTTSEVSNLKNYDDDEVILTKVISRKDHRLTSTLSYGERKHNEVDLANSYQQRGDNSEHSTGQTDQPKHGNHTGHPDHLGIVDHMGHADHPGHVNQAGIVNHMGHADHPGHKNHQRHTEHPGHANRQEIVDHPEHVEHKEHPGHVNHSGNADLPVSTNISPTKKVELSNKQQHDGSSETSEHPKHADSELDLGGPPPYLPVLNRSEIIEREKEVSQKHRGSNPTSPKLTKTVPEISEKIIETKERIRNEKIDWKKCVLFRLEKRLMKKLRRAERLTGQKTEIEDLRQEVPEPVTKRKKSRNHQRRTSRQNSVTECVTVNNDTVERLGQEGRNSRQNSVTDSVTHLERRSSWQSSETDSVTDGVDSVTDDAVEYQGEERWSSRQDSVTDSVTGVDDERTGLLQQQENVEESGNKQIESSQVEKDDKNLSFEKNIDICVDLSEKCEESFQNVGRSCVQKGNIERCKNAKNIIREDKEEQITKKLTKFECSKNICNNIEKQFSTVEKQGHVELEATNTNDVTIEHSQTRRIDTESAEKEKSRNVSQEKPTQQLQGDDDIEECVTLKSKTREKDRAVERENIFQTFWPRFQVSDSLKKDILPLPVTTEESSLNTTQDNSVIPAEKRKPDGTGTEVLKNKLSYNKRLESCGEDARDIKSKTVDHERNIWSTLRQSGIL